MLAQKNTYLANLELPLQREHEAVPLPKAQDSLGIGVAQVHS